MVPGVVLVAEAISKGVVTARNQLSQKALACAAPPTCPESSLSPGTPGPPAPRAPGSALLPFPSGPPPRSDSSDMGRVWPQSTTCSPAACLRPDHASPFLFCDALANNQGDHALVEFVIWPGQEQSQDPELQRSQLPAVRRVSG